MFKAYNFVRQNMDNNQKTILIGLNEINFEFLKAYIKKGKFKNFKTLLSNSDHVETVSEKEYELLEPWIQWVTIHTGKSYDDHKIFRLGDIVSQPQLHQIFEDLEAKGKTVGAVSPFNADNRLKNAKFFVPDPWTKTSVTGGWLVRKFYKAIHQAVNDNAQERISFTSIIALGLAFLLYVPISNWWTFINLLKNRKKPGIKAIILDSLLIDVFIGLWKKNKPDFANLFLNSGAHIQHHYMFNSSVYEGEQKNPEWYCPEDWDPLEIILEQYDRFVGQLLRYKDLRIFIATGLHQQPHLHNTYYWRLKNHRQFVDAIGLRGCKEVLPRMSIDFLLEFNSDNDAIEAEKLLNSYHHATDNDKIFRVDNRGNSLFVELKYHRDIIKGTKIISNLDGPTVSQFEDHVAFVAIKNGEHNGIGYLTSNTPLQVKGQIPLTDVKDIITEAVLA